MRAQTRHVSLSLSLFEKTPPHSAKKVDDALSLSRGLGGGLLLVEGAVQASREK